MSHTPLQVTVAGSGFHCPFFVHIDVFDPTFISPGGQAKVILAPFSAGSLYSVTSTPGPLSSTRG